MKSFTDLVFEHPEILDNFLFGNGFSQSFHSAFKYKSLYDNVKMTWSLQIRIYLKMY